MSDVARINRETVAYKKCAQIDKENQRHKQPMRLRSKQHTRWTPGVCKLCGKYFEMITQDHAHEHGFSSPDEMAKAGVVEWR